MLKYSFFEPFLDKIVDQIQQESVTLTKPLPPDPKRQSSFQKLLKSISELRGRPLFYPYISSGLGRGPLVLLADGSVKLDFVCGIGPHILGHSHPKLIKASLRGALEDTVMQGNLQMSAIYEQLFEKIDRNCGQQSSLAQAWFAPSWLYGK